MSVNEYMALWEKGGDGTYQNEFREIWDRALNTWLPLIVKTPEKRAWAEREDEHQGLPHLNNIYHIVAQLMNISKYPFSDLEYFLIATSILFHDIGRAPYDIAPAKCEPCHLEQQPQICPCQFFTGHEKRKQSEYHSYKSALMVSKYWRDLGFQDQLLADCCAYCCGLHTHKSIRETDNEAERGRPLDGQLQQFCYLLPSVKQRQFRDFRYRTTVHLHAIAALLRLGDELDNCYLRKIPSFFRESEVGKDLRNRVREVEFDATGKCIKIHIDTDVPAEDKAQTWQWALDEIDRVLEGWSSPLHELGLPFEKGFYVQLDGSLIGVEEQPGVGEAEEKTYGWTESKAEPSLAESETLSRVYRAVLSLYTGIPGRSESKTLHLESVSAEAGILDTGLTKLALHRLNNLDTIDELKIKLHLEVYGDFVKMIKRAKGSEKKNE